MKTVEAVNTPLSRLLEMLSLRGTWRTEHWRRGRMLSAFNHVNDIPTAAKTQLLNTMFNAATQIAANSWFAGLINNASFTGYNAADTYSSHAGWTEFTGYSQANRPAWGQGTAAAASITNASAIQFDITGTATIRGLFLSSNNTKGHTTAGPLLWSASSYPATVDVINGDQIRSVYTLSC